jgi:hypothetical protein
MRPLLSSFFALCLLPVPAPGADDKAGALELTVRETAGLRRFGYLVHARLKLERDVTDKDRFRLLFAGAPVPAQFRPLTALGDRKLVALDFNVNQGPLEKKTYTVEYGPKVEAGPEPKGGLQLVEGKDAVTIKSGSLSYVVSRKPRGLLQSVTDGKRAYLRKDGQGPDFVTQGHGMYGLGTTERLTVTRQGPLAVGLRFDGRCPIEKDPKKREFRWAIEMTFPRSKSWVEVDWTLDDPAGVVTEMHAGLSLLLEGTPTLADLGAGSMVYTTLRRGETAFLVAPHTGKPAWKVETRKEHEPRQLLAVAPGPKANPPEGWAHSMDRRRCTAVAMDAFGKAGNHDEIWVEGDGPVVFVRQFDQAAARVKGTKRLRFWAHFVGMPVQVGALTSPQSMMAPLAVEVKPGKPR